MICTPHHIIQVINMRFEGNVPSIGKWSLAFRVWKRGGDFRERDHLADPVVDGRIILRWNIRNWGWEYGLD